MFNFLLLQVVDKHPPQSAATRIRLMDDLLEEQPEVQHESEIEKLAPQTKSLLAVPGSSTGLGYSLVYIDAWAPCYASGREIRSSEAV